MTRSANWYPYSLVKPTLPTLPYFGLHPAVVRLLFATLLVTSAAFASSSPFPPGGYNVAREWVTSSVLRVRMTRENLPELKPQQPYEQQYFAVAGSPGQVPVVTLRRSEFFRYVDGNLQDIVTGPPKVHDSNSIIPISTVSSFGRFRQFETYRLAIQCVVAVPVPQKQEIWQARYLEFDIELHQPQPGAIASSGTAFQAPGPLAKDFLLNPDLPQAYYQSASEPQNLSEIRNWATQLRSETARGGVYQISVSSAGLHRLDTASLVIPESSSQHWRLFHLGKEIPLFDDPASGTSQPLFMASPFSEANLGFDMYWLFTKEQPGAPAPLRLAASNSRTTDVLTTRTSPSVVIYEKRYSERTDFSTRLRPEPGSPQWVWKTVRDGGFGVMSLNLPPEFRAAEASDVSLEFKFGFEFQPNLSPEIEILINGQTETRVTPNPNETAIRVPLVPSKLSTPSPQVALHVRYNKTLPQKPDVLIQHATLRWQSPINLAAISGVPFQLNPADATAANVRIASVATAQPNIPSIVTLGQSNAPPIRPELRGGQITYSFPTAGVGPYTFLTSDSASPVKAVPFRNAPPEFNEKQSTDYLLLTHDNLRPAAETLAAHRAKQGWQPTVTCVDDVFNTYGFGRRDPNALRIYMQHLLASKSEPKLSHVFLLGEASADKTVRLTSESISTADMVPVCTDMDAEKPRGDFQYSCLLGNDTVADVALGRLSVRTLSEATAAVEKIIAYDSQPIQPWMLKTEYVTDDNDEFPMIADDIIARSANPVFSNHHLRQSDVPYEVNVRVNGRLRARQGTTKLIQAFNEGRAMLNFFGHGGPNLWSHERLLHLTDLKLLQNAQSLPFITCSSCDNAWLDYPVAPADVSISELFVKKPRGGAIAVFAPVAGASPFEHQVLMRRVVEAVHQRDVREVGTATLFGLNGYQLDAASSQLCEQYVLLGDPATRLAIPVASASIRITPQSVVAQKPATIQISAPLSDRAGTATVTLRSTRTADILKSVAIPQVSGRLSTQLAVPPLARGSYAVTVEHDDGKNYAVNVARLNVDIPRLALSAMPDTTGPIVWSRGPATEQVQVSNLSAVDLRTVSLARTYSLDGRMPTTDSLGQFRDIEPFGHRTVTVQREPAVDSATVYTARAREVESVARVESFIFRPHQYPSPAYVRPIGARNRNEITVQAYPAMIPVTITNMTSSPLIGCSAQAFVNGGDISELLAVGDIPIGGDKTVVVQARQPLLPGETKVDVRVKGQIGDAQISTQLAERALVLNVSAEADLEIVSDSVRVANQSTESLTTLRTIYIQARVRNVGHAPLQQIPVSLRFGTGDTAPVAESINDMQFTTIPEVKPGEEVPVEYRWERNTTPGPIDAYLVVNGQRTLRESRFENNIAKVPPVEIAKAENLVAVDAELMNPSRTDSVFETSATLIAEFRNDGTRPFARVQLEYGTRNPATNISHTTVTELANVAPGETRAVALPLEVKPDSIEAFATINANREELEVTTTDNTVEVPIERVTPFKPSKFASHDALPLNIMRLANFDAIGDTYLRQREEPTSVSINTPFMPEFVTSANFVRPKGDSAEDRDNKWTVNPWYIGASAAENPGPLEMELPVGNVANGTPCDLFVTLSTGVGASGETFGKVRYVVGGETTETLGTFAEGSGPVGNTRAKWGTYAPQNGKLRVKVRPESGHAVRLIAYEVIPRGAIATTPILDFGTDASQIRQATVTGVTPADAPAEKYLVAWSADTAGALAASRRSTPGVHPKDLKPARFAVFEIRIPFQEGSRVTLTSIQFPHNP